MDHWDIRDIIILHPSKQIHAQNQHFKHVLNMVKDIEMW